MKWIGRSLLLLLMGILLGACGRVTAPHPAPPAKGAVAAAQDGVPDQAIQVLAYVRAHGEAPPGTEGGRRFGNYERRLPEREGGGKVIRYQEWDVWPKARGRNRGAERLVTGSDGRAWYTGDHYRTFTEVRP
ncbi:MAG TPA: ribonuclease domain-containing protein [Holophagaceae bacterium]|nr:ribonuclease domain-containing protein [Holophagaceae bacterium]